MIILLIQPKGPQCLHCRESKFTLLYIHNDVEYLQYSHKKRMGVDIKQTLVVLSEFILIAAFLF